MMMVAAMAKEWYIVHTYSGFEEKVKKSLLQRIEAKNLKDEIDDILIPSEDVVEVRDGRKIKSKRKFFPGYILIHMEMNEQNWHFVRSTPKVTGFAGTREKPTALTHEEVERILNQVTVTADKPKPKFDFKEDDVVKIIDGPFSNFTGRVEEVNQDKSTLKVMVTIFGRSTPVELDFLQVEKI